MKAASQKQFDLPSRKCIYCLVEKKSNAFNKEHVIPQLMGHYENSRTIKSVCQDCNSYFGDRVDPVLAEDSYEAILRASSGIKPPTVVDALRWNRINVTVPLGGWWGGARLKLAWRDSKIIAEVLPQIGFLRKSSGLYEFYTVKELPKIEDWSDLSEQSYKLISSTEEQENQLKSFCVEKFGSNVPFKGAPEPPPSQNAELEVEVSSRIDDLVKRAVCKIAFNYLAQILGSNNQELLLDKRFDEIRQFARFDRKLDPTRIEVKVGNEHSILKLPPNQGLKGHLIALEHAADGSLQCRFSPYDHFHYYITLALGSEKIIDSVGHVFYYGDTKKCCEKLGIRVQ